MYKGAGSIKICIPTLSNRFAIFDVHVIIADLSFLLRLKKTKREFLLWEYIRDKLIHVRHRYSIPVENKNGHCFISRNNYNVLSTRSMLAKLHLHILHSMIDLLFRILR